MFRRLLIANRGEIAIRLARAAADLGVATVAVFAADDAASPSVRAADEARPLGKIGPAAYLDIEALIAVAREAGCDAVHPGYGFLSESAAFARACDDAGLAFVGPSPEALALLGDKASARALAEREGLPVLPGTPAGATAEAMAAFLTRLPAGAAIMIKAVAGGGGIGMRLARTADDIAAAHAAAARAAEAAFGEGALYAEQALEGARHIEVQIAADRVGVLALGDRDCSLQRRRQKIVEIAPAPNLAQPLRSRLWDAAASLAAAARYRNLGTIEFLLAPDGERFFFLEANPRLQVEHTVTEEATGLDLVQLQLRLAAGESLGALGLTRAPPPLATAVQARVILERLDADGRVVAAGGRLTAYEPPSGPGVRVDGAGAVGLDVPPAYDPLIAKVIARGPDLRAAMGRLERALGEFRLEGAANNLALLRAVLAERAVREGRADTAFVEAHLPRLIARAAELHGTSRSASEGGGSPRSGETGRQGRGESPDGQTDAFHQPPQPGASRHPLQEGRDGSVVIVAPLRGTLARYEAAEGDTVRAGQVVAIVEAVKMEHEALAPATSRIGRLLATPGAVVDPGDILALLEPIATEDAAPDPPAAVDPDHIRPDLAQSLARWNALMDEARPDAVARRRARGQRTARENLADLLDPGSFVEFGAFALAAQRRRRSPEELAAISPADGLVCGLGRVNGEVFPPERSRCAALAYDFTVLAGTQGHMNHLKTDRLLCLVAEQKLPVVWFVEGGGGRPGDTDGVAASGLATPSFASFARLAGEVPKIAIASGRCFAGNAAFAGMSEILIATTGCNLGMGGPAMIEGGGLGTYAPEDIGPMAVQTANGVVDLLADDEADATRLAKQALGYFQGSLAEWTCGDQRLLRLAAPESRVRVYDVRAAIRLIADQETYLELRPAFASGLITGFIRLEGRPMGLIANDPKHLGGAIDADGADKGARFLQLCDAFDLPVLSLIDTPGFMVGPASEAAAAVRKTSRLFLNAARLGTPLIAVVLRKAYGLGAQAMAGGSTLSATAIAAWPTGEFGGMGLEGAVRLAYRRELDAEADPAARQALFDKRLAALQAAGKADNVAAMLEIDAVIDPAETRRWVAEALRACGERRPRRPRFVDAW